MLQKKSFRWVLLILVLEVCISTYGVRVDAQELRQIDVVSPRPLSDAIIALEGALDCVIPYEDPDLEYPPELYEMFKEGPIVPKGGRITFQYNPDESPEVIIEALLAEHHQQGNAGIFKLVIGPEGIYNVVPIKRRNREGRLIPTQSILDKRISFSAQDLSYQSIIDTICELLPERVGGPAVALSALYRNRCSVSWYDKEARLCINEILCKLNEQSPRKWSLWVGRDPTFPVAALNFYTVPSAPSDPCQIRIVAHRPLAEALKILEERLQCTIPYEDPLFLCACDIMQNRAGEPQIPRGGIVHFSYLPDSNAEEAIQACLASYHQIGLNTGVFTMERVHNIYCVFPVEFKNEKEELEPYQSILQTPISLSVYDKNSLEILEAICSILTKSSNRHLAVGTLPADFSQPHKSYSAVNQPARICLTEFLKDIDGSLSWQLFYDPKSKIHLINVHKIPTKL